jgi:hypothetical protein
MIKDLLFLPYNNRTLIRIFASTGIREIIWWSTEDDPLKMIYMLLHRPSRNFEIKAYHNLNAKYQD